MTTLFQVLNHLIAFIVPSSFWFLRVRRGVTNVLADIFLRSPSLLWEFEIQANEFRFLVQSMSLNIDMRRILPFVLDSLVQLPDLPGSF